MGGGAYCAPGAACALSRACGAAAREVRGEPILDGGGRQGVYRQARGKAERWDGGARGHGRQSGGGPSGQHCGCRLPWCQPLGGRRGHAGGWRAHRAFPPCPGSITTVLKPKNSFSCEIRKKGKLIKKNIRNKKTIRFKKIMFYFYNMIQKIIN